MTTTELGRAAEAATVPGVPPGGSGESFTVLDPATGRPPGPVPAGHRG
jgi:hypothetical protein